MTFETILLDQESTRKQLKLHIPTYEFLKNTKDEYVKQVSKGILFYEAVMLVRDFYSDKLTDLENCIDEELVSVVGLNFAVEVGKLKLTLSDGSWPSSGWIDDHAEKTDDPVDLYLPTEFVSTLEDEWGQRYWAQKINDVLRDYIDSPFQSRVDRIECKQEVLDYAQHGTEPDHEVARAIVEGDESKFTVGQAHEILTDDTEWWQSDELRWSEFKSRADDLPRNTDVKREALENGLKAYLSEKNVSEVNRKMATSLAADMYDIDEDYASQEYVNKITLPSETSVEKSETDWVERIKESKPENVDTLKEACQKVKDKVVDELESGPKSAKKRGKRLERISAPLVCLVNDDMVQDIDDASSTEEKLNLIGKCMNSPPYKKEYHANQQQEAYDAIQTHLLRMKEDLIN